MIRPLLQDDEFLADVDAASSDELLLWWLGQSGFLVCFGDLRFLLDPYLSDSLTRKYAGTDKPHVRMTERVVAPERLKGISFVAASHVHTDHLDAETLVPLLEANPDAVLVYPEAISAAVADRAGSIREGSAGLTPGESAMVAGAEIMAVPAAHDELSPATLGYVVRVGGWTIYHSGDTIPYEGMAELLTPYEIDVALLPINGRRSERQVAGNLWGDEAADLAHRIGASVVVPCHYEMFAFNTETPDLFVETCQRLGQPYVVLSAGGRLSMAR